MRKMICATRFMTIIVALALVAVPALASTEVAENSETNFHALSAIATDEQTPAVLSDSQLAEVEGQGPLLDSLVGGILVGQAFINLPGSFWDGFGMFLQVGLSCDHLKVSRILLTLHYAS